MKPIIFKGWEGDEMSLGTLEGSGAPILVVKQNKSCAAFCFEDPQQVRDLIKSLEPFTK